MITTLRSRIEAARRDPVVSTAALILVGFVVIDRAILRLAEVPPSAFSDSTMLPAALASRWLLVVICLVAIALAGPRRLARINWDDLGQPLRTFTGVLIVFLVWRRAAEAYDFVHSEWHLGDRVLLGLFGVVAMFRPAAVLLVALTARVLAEPLVDTVVEPSTNIVELPILMLVVIGAASVVAARRDRYNPAAIVPVLTATIAAQFYLPGLIKLRSGWAWANPVSNLPLNGHAQGWLGGGSGDLATTMSDLMGSTEILFIVGTLGFEIGGLFALWRNRPFGLWLMCSVVFHIGALLALGFVFFEFIVVELAMLGLFWSKSGRRWAADGFRGVVPLVGSVAVVLASLIFHPPTLAWYDGPVVVRYDIDGIDEQGTRWALDSDDFAPYDGLVAFSSLELGPTPPLASAYGAVSRVRFRQLDPLQELDEFAELSRQLPPTCDPHDRAKSVEMLERFLVESGRLDGRLSVGPPLHFPTDRPGPDRPDSLQLVRLDVDRTTVVRLRGTENEIVEDVLTVDLDTTGTGAVTTWHFPDDCRSAIG